MPKTGFRYRGLLLLGSIALLLKFVSLYPARVETSYTYGFYAVLSKALRFITGWLPFSMGDVLYAAAGIRLLFYIWKIIKAIRKKAPKAFWYARLYKLSCALLGIFIVFNVLWGLNYYRQGIAHQLQLQVEPYALPEVIRLTETLQAKLNSYAAVIDTVQRARESENEKLFQKAILVYGEAQKNDPFLQYINSAVKPSLYSRIGHYIGFTGYYNPFSSEAQIKTSIPVFLKPFVVTHEIAHQLGYAKENEANFVAFLSCRQSRNPVFLYSLYYNLYRYALREVYSRDSIAARAFQTKLHPQVMRDNEVLKAYFISTENRIEPIITRFYDQYLKWNNQKEGMQSYNEVVALLIAYGKKNGWAAI